MRFKYKIQPFVFGVSIGLLVGVTFFIFKIDDYLKKLSKPNTDNIKVTEQVIVAYESKENDAEATTKQGKPSLTLKNSPSINYDEVDNLIKEDGINIAQEELLSIKNIKVINLDLVAKRDTLTGQLAGITSSEYPNLFFVEFWKTPLNSKGYRMTRNRVILYGLSDFSSITIYKVDDNFYLKNDDIVYKLSVGTEFKQMELVNDNDLLTKIN